MMSNMTSNILSILIWLPILGGILILSTGGDRSAQLARKIALGFSAGTFLLSLSLYADFDITTASMQFVNGTRGSRTYTSSTLLVLMVSLCR